jgi:hypothetical protein
MKNIINKYYKHCLIGKINGLSDEVKRTRVKLLKGKTETHRNEIAVAKRFVGNESRHYLLAYAFMRGDSYLSIERKCRSENKPSAERILEIVHSHMYKFMRSKVTIDMVKAWLAGE